MFSKDELEIFYTALVHYTTAELREKLSEDGHHGLAEKVSPLGMAFLAMKIKAVAEEVN